jgi:hypothetical protein
MTATATHGRVVVQAAMSLDGFIAGPGHGVGWVFEHSVRSGTVTALRLAVIR